MADDRTATIPIAYLGKLFNRGFAATGRGYVKVVGFGLRVPLFVLAGYFAIVGVGVAELQTMPTGFIPQQDKGYLVCSIQLPDAASAKRTEEYISRITHVALDLEMDDGHGNRVHPVKHVSAIAGNSFVLSAYGSNFGSMFIILDGFDKRSSPKLSANAVSAELRKKFAAATPGGLVNVFGAPAVPRLGRAGGFRIMIEDRGDVGPDVLQGQTDSFVEAANQQKQLVGLFTVFKTNSPQLFLDVDRGDARFAGSISARCTRRFRDRWGTATPTTSTASAAPGRWTCKPLQTIAPRLRT